MTMKPLRILQSLTAVVHCYTASFVVTTTAFTTTTVTTVVQQQRRRPPPPPAAAVPWWNSQPQRRLSSSSSLLLFVPEQYHPSATTTSSTTQLFMGWGPEPIWSSASILAPSSNNSNNNNDACPSGKSVLISISVPTETYQSYTIPGQYVQVQPSAAAASTTAVSDGTDDAIQPAFLAICSPPPPSSTTTVTKADEDTTTTKTFQFLVKRTTNNEWLTEATPGTTVQVSQVLGNGYTISDNIDGLKYDFPTQNLLLFAAGSGIAPIAAAISSGVLGTTTSTRNRSCRLYYGERTSEDLCFVDQFSQWENMGIEVVPVLSQPNDDWQGRCGYVQTALAEDGIAIPRNTAALLCGMKGMTESVKELLLAAGVFDGRILFNF